MFANKTVSMAVLGAALTCGSSFARAERDATTIEKAKIGMGAAIVAAEKASGGKAMEAEVTTEKDAPAFDVIVLLGDSTKHFLVTASTATPTTTENKSLVAKVEKEGKSERDAAKAASVSLKDAVATVEKQTHGKATDASIEVENKKPQYVVEVVVNGKSMKKHVDAASGAIIAAK